MLDVIRSGAQTTESARVPRAYTVVTYALMVERVLQVMRARLDAPPTLDEMGEIAGLSAFHFHRVFRSVTGAPPGEFLAALRLDAAKRLLLTTSLSVTDVCYELGYASLGTFTTRFTQQVGLSPTRLRQIARVLADEPLQPRIATHIDMRRRITTRFGGVGGVVIAPPAFTGLVFIGLFPKSIPQGQPVACATLPAPGHFQLNAATDGSYYALAAAAPYSQDALTYLTPNAGVLVAVATRPLVIRGGQASESLSLTLRPLDPTDPPILGVFPPLLSSPAAMRALTRDFN
ncbi:MAG TPA: AraC family transcriptional regulator [Ktedonobacterales bacterium]|nr:AraC family transcriptional regulator [Ktedonobacterales bacterium]